ncbi:MAG: HEAT repeat domain-containing protein [Armatimonadetes bacterium]|nr:HEAT repeat domain-containing protein [Armatimonadota bacterium]
MTKMVALVLICGWFGWGGVCAAGPATPVTATNGSATRSPDCDEASVPELIAILRERGTFAVRAAQLLADRHATSAIPDLALLLTDPKISLRINAARAMALLGDRSGLPVLRAALTEGDDFHASIAAAFLAQLGDDSGRAVLERELSSQNWIDRRQALYALALLPDGLSDVAVAAALEDERPEVQRSAFRVAWKNASDRVREVLIKKTQSPDPLTRWRATEALFMSNPHRNAEIAIGMITDPDRLVQGQTSMMLAHFSRVAVPRVSGWMRSAERARDLKQAYLEWLAVNRDVAFPPTEPAPPAPQ